MVRPALRPGWPGSETASDPDRSVGSCDLKRAAQPLVWTPGSRIRVRISIAVQTVGQERAAGFQPLPWDDGVWGRGSAGRRPEDRRPVSFTTSWMRAGITSIRPTCMPAADPRRSWGRRSRNAATASSWPPRSATRPGENLNDQGLSRYHMIRSVDASLRRLQTDVIDLLIAHAWDPLTPLEETLRAFDDLVASGKVRYIGVSNFKAWQLMKALALSDAHGWSRFTAAQYQYSLVERNIEHEISELCLHEGLGLTPWGPLGGGFLSGKYRPGEKPQDGRLAMMPDETEESWSRRSKERNWSILQVVAEIARPPPSDPLASRPGLVAPSTRGLLGHHRGAHTGPVG